MDKSIFKYLSPEVARLALTPSGAVFKCSYPKDFNDPYELFLTINFNERPDALAFYQEVVGDIPQLPTTCFSNSPAITPMWAHYGKNLEGVVVQLNEECLSRHLPESGFGDVDYEDGPSDGLTDLLYRAFVIGKPRYTYLLQQGVFSAAYYTKKKCWEHEQERRMICSDGEVESRDGMMLMHIPKDCITALIVGPRASQETKGFVEDYAKESACDFFVMKIGRSSSEPHFVGSAGDPYLFVDGQISRCASHCAKCKEPSDVSSELCSWCAINDHHRESAAATNPYRMLARVGMLDDYVKSMDDITRRHSRDDV
jgi:hypothetical protein